MVKDEDLGDKLDRIERLLIRQGGRTIQRTAIIYFISIGLSFWGIWYATGHDNLILLFAFVLLIFIMPFILLLLPLRYFGGK